MRNVVALHSSVLQFVRCAIPEPRRRDERAWLAKVVERSVIRGGEFSRFRQPADRRLCRNRLAFESERLRRAFRAGETIEQFNADLACAVWRDIPVMDGAYAVPFSEIVDWLLALEESDRRLHAKLTKVTLVQAAGHARRWHARMLADTLNRPTDAAPARPEPETAGGGPFNRPFVFVDEPGFMPPINPFALRVLDTPAVEDDPNGVERFLEVGGGLAWVRLTTPEALDYESCRMRHCVGKGSYDHGVISGATWILSLRDAENAPSLTVEYSPAERAVHQIKAPGNQAAPDETLDAVTALFERLQPQSSGRDLARAGLRWTPPVRDTVGSMERIERNEGFTWSGIMPEGGLNLIHAPMSSGMSFAHSHAVAYEFMQQYMRTQRLGDDPPDPAVQAKDGLDARTRKGKGGKPFPWCRARRPTLDMLRAIANNPAAAEEDRREARVRMREMMMPGIAA